jgi:2-oxoglutarate/2-oxoacid ferredoxin oxidoreductase subunit beta
LEEAKENNWLVTGLIYLNTGQPTVFDQYNIPETPLNRTPAAALRPGQETLAKINQMMR